MLQLLAIQNLPWPWWLGGISIAFVYLMLRYVGQRFGVSSSFEMLCSVAGAGKIVPFFKRDSILKNWRTFFIVGTILGGAIASNFMQDPDPIQISDATVSYLEANGVSSVASQLAPPDIFSWEQLKTPRTLILLIIGGFLVGFGTRYAGGCTSGHAISGLSELQLPSLVAVVGFFAGGLFTTFVLLPWIFTLV